MIALGVDMWGGGSIAGRSFEKLRLSWIGNLGDYWMRKGWSTEYGG